MPSQFPGGRAPNVIAGISRRRRRGPGLFQKRQLSLEPTSTQTLISQVETEVIVSSSAPGLRLSQVVGEALIQPTSGKARVSQVAVEVLIGVAHIVERRTMQNVASMRTGSRGAQ